MMIKMMVMVKEPNDEEEANADYDDEEEAGNGDD